MLFHPLMQAYFNIYRELMLIYADILAKNTPISLRQKVHILVGEFKGDGGCTNEGLHE